MQRYKDGFFFSREFLADNSWNGYEHKCLFANAGGGQFVDVARALGTDTTRDGRGVAVGDLNGDGRLDLVMNNNDAPPTVYLNNLARTGNWLKLTLVGRQSNRDAIGARVRVTVDLPSGSKTMTRQVEAGSGYASQSDTALHFGLGDARVATALEVTWPSGLRQRFDAAHLTGLVNRAVYLEEGEALRTTSPLLPVRATP